jgi:hypothetical protein
MQRNRSVTNTCPGHRRACNLFSVVVNYNTNQAGLKDEELAMRTSDRFWATTLAVVVWLFAGYAVASGSMASTAISPPAFDATAALAAADASHR